MFFTGSLRWTSSDDKLALITHAGDDNHVLLEFSDYRKIWREVSVWELKTLACDNVEWNVFVLFGNSRFFIEIFVMLAEISQIYKFGLLEEECTEWHLSVGT